MCKDNTRLVSCSLYMLHSKLNSLECDVQVINTSKPDLVLIMNQVEENCLNHNIPTKTVVTDANSTLEQKKIGFQLKRGCLSARYTVKPFIFTCPLFSRVSRLPY